MQVKREWIEELIFGTEASRRFTQDSPILPDVWIAYGTALGRGEDPEIDLLLTPHQDYTAGQLFHAVRTRLDVLRDREIARAPASGTPVFAAYHQSAVVVSLRFEELLLAVLPLTEWWRKYVCRYPGKLADLRTEAGWQVVSADLRRALEDRSTCRGPEDLLWLIVLVGSILGAREAAREGPGRRRKPETVWREILRDTRGMLDRFRDAVLRPMDGDSSCDQPDAPPCVFMVSRNREARPTLTYSVKAVKADAARRVFEARCAGLAWAIIDSGIDATHPAFRLRDAADKPLAEPFAGTAERPVNQTRVMGTFDFTRIRQILSANPAPKTAELKQLEERVASCEARVAKLREAVEGASEDSRPGLEKLLKLHQVHLESVKREHAQWVHVAEEPDEDAQALLTALSKGRVIDWEKIRPLIEVPHDAAGYRPPRHEHGTHVAGILGADWRVTDWPLGDDAYTAETLAGVCPDIRLYDFRVFDDEGNGDEFSVMAALQFLRYLNEHRDQMLVHGTNLSLSIPHDVSNFACGRTPVCDECERVVSSGVVVVAAAGNQGYNRYSTLTPAGAASLYEGYSSISIVDPGNAEAVITVGSTHRMEPHTYGVSYFSSRGPTGDGRYKPDLVAPGEKIMAPVPAMGAKPKDGTSMAAPHVSGAAALIMARYREFIGRPARVKQVLCDSATDLGRDRYFQGAGMLDILRALQSV